MEEILHELYEEADAVSLDSQHFGQQRCPSLAFLDLRSFRYRDSLPSDGGSDELGSSQLQMEASNTSELAEPGPGSAVIRRSKSSGRASKLEDGQETAGPGDADNVRPRQLLASAAIAPDAEAGKSLSWATAAMDSPAADGPAAPARQPGSAPGEAPPEEADAGRVFQEQRSPQDVLAVPVKQDVLEEASTRPLALPALEAASAAELAQARLERIWQILRFPVRDRLEMVVRFMRTSQTSRLHETLEAWEQAAAAVLERERCLAALLGVQQLLHDEEETRNMDAAARKEVAACAESQAFDFLVSTCYVEVASDKLSEAFNEVLTMDGVPYPGHEPLDLERLEEFVAMVQAFGAD